MKTKILILSLILTAGITNGQDLDSLPDHKLYSVSILSGRNQIREMNLLPMTHKGMVRELSLETEKIKNSMRQFRFFFTYSRLKTTLEELAKSANIRIGMNYSYNFLIMQKKNIRFYSGPQTSLCYSFMIYPNWDESHSYWSDYLSFGINNVLSVSQKNENVWLTSLNFSLLGFFSRPDYSRPYKMDNYTPGGVLSDLNSNIETGMINKVFSINCKTEYRIPAFTDKHEAFTFNMEFLRMSRNGGSPVFQIINQIGIKFIL